MNRADGPEDRSLAERCLAGTLPNLGAVYQIVQSPGQVGIYHDSGQGQGFVRVVPVNGTSKHAPHLSASGTATRAAGGRVTRWSSTSRISLTRGTSRARARTCI